MTLTNTPRDYDWGSATLLARLEGREPSGRPEAEVWYGDHPGSPARVADGRTLDRWLAAEGAAHGAPERLPYLLKLLAAASSLSIQVHPSKAQAAEGFAREDAAGIARDAPERVYRDDNHKPELLVAVSEEFTALSGLRDLETTRRLLALLGRAGTALGERLSGTDAAAALRATIAWLLSDQNRDDVAVIIDGIIAAAGSAEVAAAPEAIEFTAELALVRDLGERFPGDPGIVVALLMNLVRLQRGEGLYVPAGVLHAYQRGLGVELMAASDNVLRGGLTSKHVDAVELMAVLDATPGPAAVLRPDPDEQGVAVYDTAAPDFALARATVVPGRETRLELRGTAILLGTSGSVRVRGRREEVTLEPGGAVLVPHEEHSVVLTGDGVVFAAQPGRRPLVHTPDAARHADGAS